MFTKWLSSGCAVLIVGCANGPSINYDSDPQPMLGSSGGFEFQGDAGDAPDAQALEQTESDCASQGKHTVSQRVEGEMTYSCAAD